MEEKVYNENRKKLSCKHLALQLCGGGMGEAETNRCLNLKTFHS
jgi:hypothetical protein